MTRNKTIRVLLLSLSLVFSNYVFAEDSTTTTTTTTSTDTSSDTNDTSGLASAYNYSLPSLSSSGCCKKTYDYNHANNNAIAVMTNFNQKLAALQLALIESLRLQTGQQTSAVREQTGASHTLADQQDDRATVKSVEQARIDAIRSAQSGSSTCAIVTGSRLAGTVPTSYSYSSALATELEKWSSGQEGPSKYGTDQAQLERIQTLHCGKYATSADVTAGTCSSVGSSELQDADIDVSKSLLARNGTVNALSSDQITASKAFIINSVDPKPLGPLAENEGSTPAGKLKAAERNANISRMSIAGQTMADILSKKIPITDSSAVSWAKSAAAEMNGYKDSASKYSTNGISLNDWLELTGNYFALSPTKGLNSDISAETATKDSKNILSIIAMQNYYTYQSLEYIKLNLAVQTAMMAEESRKGTSIEN